jgi:DNA-binding transcriptional ArsR family regulator
VGKGRLAPVRRTGLGETRWRGGFQGGADVNDPMQPNRCARLLGALAAPERLRIVSSLRAGPRTVTDLAEALGVSVVNVSHHLMVLRHAGLVRGAKKGRFVRYSLVPRVFQTDGKSVRHLNLGCCRIELPEEKKLGG